MDKDIVAYEVYRTTDYGKFYLIDENRDVKGSRVKKILDSINKVGFRRVPIVVNEKMEILDGQGRYEALKKLGLPIDYVIDPGAGIEVCRQLNIGQTNWSPIDYAKSYATSGNKNYQNFLDLLDIYDCLSFQEVLGICEGNIVFSGWQTAQMKDGDLNLPDSRVNEVIPYLDFVSSVIKELEAIGGNKRTLVTMISWITAQEGVDVNRIKKIIVEKYPIIDPCADVVRSLTQISDLYNKGLKDKSKRMYFEILYKEGK